MKRVWATVLRALSVPSRQVAIIAVAVAAVIVVSFAEDQVEDYGRSMAQAERDTRNAAQLLAEHAARTFERVEETLLAVGRLRADAARGIYRSQASIFVHLNTVRGGSSVVDEVGWLNNYGDRIATSRLVDPPRLNAADREFFRVHENNPSAGVYLSAPQEHDGLRQIDVSVRMENLDGSFAGVAYGAVNPQQFANIYEALNLGEGQSVELLRRDGVILAIAPDLTTGAQSLGDSALVREYLPRLSSGSYEMRSPLDHALRVGSYATVRGTRGQLVINVSVPRATVQAAYFTELRGDALHAGASLLALLVVSGLLVAGLRRRERLQAELAKATEAAHAARVAAEAGSRAKSAFLARMSHELRTPLNAVIGFAQMLDLDRPGTLDQTQKEYCRYIINGGEHLLKLVNEVLDLSGVEAGRLVLAPERVGVADMIVQIGDSMAPLAERAGVTLTIAPVDVSDVTADPLRLRQVLINLVANAIKYNRPGGSVTLTAAAASKQVRFIVTDTGIGIAPERHAKLFEPFSRMDSSYTAVEGTGLGLALSERLVDAMGGTIGFTSQVGLGSQFWFELPLATAGARRTPPALAAAPAAVNRPRATLLYVEDNPVNLRLMEHLLASRSDVAMLAAARAQLGLELALAHRPDVIVLDINLPEMSGYQLLRRLRAMPETRHIPVLALTALAQPEEIRKGLAAGFFRYLTKPIEVNALMTALDEAIAERSVSRGVVRTP